MQSRYSRVCGNNEIVDISHIGARMNAVATLIVEMLFGYSLDRHLGVGLHQSWGLQKGLGNPKSLQA